MAAKKRYLVALNLGILGFNGFLYLFEPSKAKEDLLENPSQEKTHSYSVGNLVENSKNSPLEKSKVGNKENILLTLKIFADKQYDYDQNIYLAEGNVKAILNGGILRSDSLSYEKSTGTLSAKGNIRFRKGGQYFKGKEFKFNLLKKEGIIKDVYGIIDIDNVLNDLRIDSDSEEIPMQNRSLASGESSYNDGIEFSLGNIKLPENQITRSNKSIGLINNWRFKSNSITINKKGWKSNKITFTNDPFDPYQISFEGIDVIAEEDDDNLLITSSKTNLLLENRTKIFIGKRIFGGEKKKKNKFQFMYDSKDRDGLVLVRRINTKNINNIELELQPQFLINRAIVGQTNSYKYSQDKSINFSDLFGLNIKIKAIGGGWNFESLNDLSTFNINRINGAIRHSSAFRKYVRMPILEDSSFNIFTTYRSRAWNGTIGETEIKSALGGFIEKTKYFTKGEVKNNLNIRIGTAKYEAEELENSEMITLWRSSLFASLGSEYLIWKSNPKNIDKKKNMLLSPVSIRPELVFRTNINSAYFKYINSIDQGFIKLSLGPEIRLGTLERNFLDYTKISVMPGVKLKFGNSPFKFDNAIDLKTLNISLLQQIYGPLMLDFISNINIDNSSKNYGNYYDTKLGLLWHKRSYEFGIYYHPDNEAGGLYFRINGFKFGDFVKAEF